MGQELPGVQPTLFFAPAQIAKRQQDWGAQGFQQRSGKAWLDFVARASNWIRIVHGHGLADIERIYQDTLAGRTKPNEGHVLSPTA